MALPTVAPIKAYHISVKYITHGQRVSLFHLYAYEGGTTYAMLHSRLPAVSTDFEQAANMICATACEKANSFEIMEHLCATCDYEGTQYGRQSVQQQIKLALDITE